MTAPAREWIKDTCEIITDPIEHSDGHGNHVVFAHSRIRIQGEIPEYENGPVSVHGARGSFRIVPAGMLWFRAT